MPRRKFCVANWKMNFNCTDTKFFLENWNNKELNNKEVKTIFCPSFTELNTGAEILQYSDSEIGAQNVFYESNGAYTGEVSAEMLKAIGIDPEKGVVRLSFVHYTSLDEINSAIKALDMCL